MPLPSRVSDLTGFDLLLSVTRTGSIGRAAAEHGISQPAASARMRLLEAQLGLALIELSSTTAIKAAVAAGGAGSGPAVLSSLAVAAELSAGTLRAVPVIGLDLTRTLRAVWTAGRRLTGPARDLYAIAARSGRRART